MKPLTKELIGKAGGDCYSNDVHDAIQGLKKDACMSGWDDSPCGNCVMCKDIDNWFPIFKEQEKNEE